MGSKCQVPVFLYVSANSTEEARRKVHRGLDQTHIKQPADYMGFEMSSPIRFVDEQDSPELNDADNLRLEQKSIYATSGEKFSGAESATMAFLIYKRFGRDLQLATNKWKEMLGNSTSQEQFLYLVQQGERLYNVLTGK